MSSVAPQVAQWWSDSSSGRAAFFKTPASTRDLLAIARRTHDLRTEENEIVGEGGDQRHPIGIRAADINRGRESAAEIQANHFTFTGRIKKT